MTSIVIFHHSSPEKAEPSGEWDTAKSAKSPMIYLLSFIHLLYLHYGAYMHGPYLHSFNVQYVSITHTLRCYVCRKTKAKSKNEQRKKECVFIVRPEEGAEWGNAALKSSGSKVKSLLWTVHFKLWFAETQLSEFLAGFEHSSPSPKHPDLCDGACPFSPLPVCVQFMSIILHMWVWFFDGLCVFSDSGGLQNVRSREAAWTNAPEITDPLNNPDWPKTKSMCEYLPAYLSSVDVLCRLS